MENYSNMIMSIHLIQFAHFCEVKAICQLANFFHLCYEAKEMNKTQVLMDKISTLSWIEYHEIWICHKDYSSNILEIFISFVKAYFNFIYMLC